MRIEKKILNKTTGCKNNFVCLSGEKNIYCKVDTHISDEVYFVTCLAEINCNYKISFGQKTVCTCPTRKEIYHKYKN